MARTSRGLKKNQWFIMFRDTKPKTNISSCASTKSQADEINTDMLDNAMTHWTCHIFATTLDQKSSKIREKQIRSLRDFVDAQNIPSEEGVFFAGDFNVDCFDSHGTGEYKQVCEVLGVDNFLNNDLWTTYLDPEEDFDRDAYLPAPDTIAFVNEQRDLPSVELESML